MKLVPRIEMQLLIATASMLAAVGVCYGGEGVFPRKMPETKPRIPLGAALERMFKYPAPRLQDNEPCMSGHRELRQP